MHARIVTALVATIVVLTSAPALAAEPVNPVADPGVVQAVETALVAARKAETATKTTSCLAEEAATAAAGQVRTGDWVVSYDDIRSACKVLKVFAVVSVSTESPAEIATALTDKASVKASAGNAYASRHGIASFRADEDSPAATILLVAEPRRTPAFVAADTTAVNRAFAAARSAKQGLKHSTCLHTAARAWAKERVATAGSTPSRRAAIEKSCKQRALGAAVIDVRGSTKTVLAKVKKSSIFRVYAGRRTPVVYSAAVYVDQLSGTKRVIFLAGQPK